MENIEIKDRKTTLNRIISDYYGDLGESKKERLAKEKKIMKEAEFFKIFDKNENHIKELREKKKKLEEEKKKKELKARRERNKIKNRVKRFFNKTKKTWRLIKIKYFLRELAIKMKIRKSNSVENYFRYTRDSKVNGLKEYDIMVKINKKINLNK